MFPFMSHSSCLKNLEHVKGFPMYSMDKSSTLLIHDYPFDLLTKDRLDNLFWFQSSGLVKKAKSKLHKIL